MGKPLISEPDFRAAMERTPPELHRLLAWLVTGTLPDTGTLNGTT